MRLSAPLVLAALLAAPIGASAQSNPALYLGQIPSPAQWNGYFSAKQDWLGLGVSLVGNNAGLKAIVAPAVGQGALREGFYTAGDGSQTFYTYSAASCSLNSGLGDNGSQVASAGGGCWLAAFGGTFPIGAFGAVGDGATSTPTDNTTAIANALAACSAAGGGNVTIGPAQYAFGINASQDLYVPRYCSLSGGVVPEFSRSAYTNFTATPYTLVAYNSRALHVLQGATVQRIIERASIVGASAPTTQRATINFLASFTGTGLVFGTTATSGDASDANVRDSVFVGFNTCVSSQNNSRISGEHLRGDCTNGINVQNSQDWSNFRDVEWYPALTLNAQPTVEVFTVTGAANNGAGLIRLTLTAPTSSAGYSPPITGDRMDVWGIGGITATSYNPWTVTVISTGSTVVVDLQGSTFAGTYTSGGAAGFNNYKRLGSGYLVGNGAGTNFEQSNDFGHQICVNLNSTAYAGGTKFEQLDCDLNGDTEDNSTVGIQLSAFEVADTISQGSVSNHELALSLNGVASSSRPNTVSFMNFYPISAQNYIISVAGGDNIMVGNSVFGLTNMYVYTGANLLMSAMYAPAMSVQFQSGGVQATTIGAGNVIAQTVNSCCAFGNGVVSASIGGSALAAGACATQSVSYPGVQSNQVVSAMPANDPGAGFYYKTVVPTTGTVTLSVCAAVAGTPAATTFQLRVLQ